MIYNRNEALESDALYFDAARLKMALFTDANGNRGPRHVFERPGVKVEDNVSFFANSSTMPWITIGAGSVVNCGKGVKESIPANTEV